MAIPSARHDRLARACGAAVLLWVCGALAQQPAPSPAPATPPALPEGLKPQASEDVKQPPDRKADEDVIQRVPGTKREPLQFFPPMVDPSQVPPPTALTPRETVPVPDRWRIMQALGFKFPWHDPYNQNVLKGDLPVGRDPWLEEHFPSLAHKLQPDWFFNASLISDSLIEARRLPTPVPAQTATRTPSLDIFGHGEQMIYSQTLIASFSLSKGDTTFRPPDYEFRFVPAFNYNLVDVEEKGALRVDPSYGTRRRDKHLGIQEMFADFHLRNVSDRFDFDSVRVGIQPFQSDFRGFIFQDVPFGVRLFGNRDSNRYQYNLAWLRRLEKDTNSGLNDPFTAPRRDDTFVGNLYRQDTPFPGFTSQVTAMYNINREGNQRDFYDSNGFLTRPAVLGDGRPHNYQVLYLGYSGDGNLSAAPGGWLDGWNLSTSLYAALGHDDRNPLSGSAQDIRAGFAAFELSRDFSWTRVRLNAAFQSGDKDPFDGKSTGFDAILENPQFAGADTSFWIRQPIPLIGGGGIALSGRNGLLVSLRSSKDQGQSNFINPGLVLLGAGADVDVLPQLRAITNISYLRFQDTTVLGVLRNQKPPDREIGWDVSGAVQWRPFMTQNIILNASAAVLLPGKGLRELFDEDKRGPQYSVLVNLLLNY